MWPSNCKCIRVVVGQRVRGTSGKREQTFMSCDGSSKLLEKISRLAEEEKASSKAAAADPRANRD
jgi:hypothetical protein